MPILSCHSSRSSYPIGTKIQLFVPLHMKFGKNPLYGFRWVVWKCWRMTDGRTDDGYLAILWAHLGSDGMKNKQLWMESLCATWKKQVHCSLQLQFLTFSQFGSFVLKDLPEKAARLKSFLKSVCTNLFLDKSTCIFYILKITQIMWMFWNSLLRYRNTKRIYRRAQKN